MTEQPQDCRRVPYPSPCLSLGEACERAGEDDDGRRCPFCPLRELCLDESRWVVHRRVWPL